VRRRIFWLVIATTSVVVVSFVVPLCLLVRTIAQDRAMAAADQEARSVAILVTRVRDQQQLTEVVEGLDPRGVARTGVLTPDGAVVGPLDVPPTDSEVRRAVDGEAFTVVDDAGGRVLLPVVTSEGTAVVRASVTPADLRRGVTTAWLGLIGLGAVLLALSAAVASRLGRRISEPLYDVAGVAHRLREGDLGARAEARGTEETVELAQALNGLAERTTELLAEERLAVADLSHRLRTPVTALRLDAEAVPEPASPSGCSSTSVSCNVRSTRSCATRVARSAPTSPRVPTRSSRSASAPSTGRPSPRIRDVRPARSSTTAHSWSRSQVRTWRTSSTS
jgi:HAMP domain-containing protein